MRKKYNPLRNYKHFKKEYLYFVVFVRCGDVYYTFDADAKIMMYYFDKYRCEQSFMISKEKFNKVLRLLLSNGINVTLTGWKNAREYYSNKPNDYIRIRTKSKNWYKEKTKGLGDYYE